MTKPTPAITPPGFEQDRTTVYVPALDIVMLPVVGGTFHALDAVAPDATGVVDPAGKILNVPLSSAAIAYE
jgi:hypothetical protein